MGELTPDTCAHLYHCTNDGTVIAAKAGCAVATQVAPRVFSVLCLYWQGMNEGLPALGRKLNAISHKPRWGEGGVGMNRSAGAPF